MRVEPISTNNYRKNPNFKNWHRTVLKNVSIPGVEDVLHRNRTYFFRNTHFWPRLCNFLMKVYKDVPKVNVYCYGCSDGSEPFTFIMQMLSSYQEEAVKFFPIMAKDYDSFAIEKARSNNFEMTVSERDNINTFTHGKYQCFIDEKEKFSIETRTANVAIKKELYDFVDFDVADILTDYKNILPDNTVVFARNFWPYLTRDIAWSVQKNLLNNLYQQLGKNSYLVIGEFDNYDSKGEIKRMIKKAGFVKTSIENVYKKVSEKDKRTRLGFFKKVLEIFK